jgi:hypothetical protein
VAKGLAKWGSTQLLGRRGVLQFLGVMMPRHVLRRRTCCGPASVAVLRHRHVGTVPQRPGRAARILRTEVE